MNVAAGTEEANSQTQDIGILVKIMFPLLETWCECSQDRSVLTAGMSTKEMDAHYKYFPAQRALDNASFLMMMRYKKSACPLGLYFPTHAS